MTEGYPVQPPASSGPSSADPSTLLLSAIDDVHQAVTKLRRIARRARQRRRRARGRAAEPRRHADRRADDRR